MHIFIFHWLLNSIFDSSWHIDVDLYGGSATSGMGFKESGRVGDSPLIGSGLYVDNEVGAATATGTKAIKAIHSYARFYAH